MNSSKQFFLDSHCEAADIFFHFKAFGNVLFSDHELAEMGFKALLDKQGDSLFSSSGVLSGFGAHPECQPCPVCSLPCSLLKGVICAKQSSKHSFNQQFAS